MARECCKRCDFPIVTCLCEAIKPVNNRTKLIVLQHPDEVKNKKNTIKLAKMACSNIEVFIGESEQDFADIMQTLVNSKTALLFPSDSATPFDQLASDISFDYLVILDGTWRKAKRIYFVNPWLKKLPHLQFALANESQYSIRSTSQEFSLSSIEAIAYSLEKLENLPPNNLLDLLNAFTVQFTKKMPEHVKQRYQ
ncbi:DTW domain-containing protein [Psychrosphaera sp. B3R10]|uniref:tRNA-uridine aminocarboxypropyltransferase n=1 Tax=unclassified Psychrosphaera TaxID=2641570 RepID=UPI001C097221|nr:MULTISPECIES: tRNA-uridine aminocarboxypropyltransferase [unclassified Psychrosphaera]MBU2881363.1 DTW domain-containing protein [Psychrosphaera sp. I2R16]MBU2988462.1 DTW domain-containing protein [Psychrosphaera sp. B3R10]